jgi:hypothetical protein
MSTDSDSSEIERSRAAVAVACLQWLRCTGPTAQPRPTHVPSPVVADLREFPTNVSPDLDLDSPHPLWDRWIDG